MKTTRLFSAVMLMLLIGLLSACNPNGGNNNGSTTQNTAGVQTVYVSVEGANYVFSPAVLKKDVPARLVFDMNTVDGCARSIVIPSFGIRGYVSEKNNVITFTPTKTGTFNIACSMNMYRGTFSVE